MKLPKVGEKFYWKDLDSIIHEEICFKIEEEDNSDLETMFFVELTKNGGGEFVAEEDILDPDSDEVKKFKEEMIQKNLKDINDYINQEKVKKILIEKLTKEYDWLEANKNLDILLTE
jgi:hypothetical protein